MTAERGALNQGHAGGLRTRYFPKSRIGQGLISVAPWVNLVLLLFGFLLVESKLVLQPGVVVELPMGPLREGTTGRLVAVVLSIPAAAGAPPDHIVFFDDERYRVSNEDQMAGLKQALFGRRRESGEMTLVIQADQRVPHDLMMRLINTARDVGIRRVNLAERPL